MNSAFTRIYRLATDPSQLIPQCASKFPHQTAAGSGRHAEIRLEICDGYIAIGGRDHHRGLHRQSLHRRQARRGYPVAAAVSSAEPEEGRRQDPVRSRPRLPSRSATSPSRASRRRASRKRPSSRKTGLPRSRRSRSLRKDRRQAGGNRKHPGQRPRRHPPCPREKAIAKIVAAPRAAIAARPPLPSVAAQSRRRLPRPQRSRKSIATPTIWRARRSSGCAARATVRRGRRKPPASRMRPRVATAPWSRQRAAGSAASAADHGLHAAG